MRSRVTIAAVIALLLVVAYARAQQFGNQLNQFLKNTAIAGAFISLASAARAQ